MRRAAIHRSFVARAAASVAALVVPLCSSAAAAANPPPEPAPTTATFQVPMRFVAGCSWELLECWGLPSLTTVSPSATPSEPGVVTFAAEHATRISAGTMGCLDVGVNWRNLTTGATGAIVLRRVEVDYSRPYPPNPWCRYTPATAVTGGGTVVATADIGAFILPSGAYRIVVNPGFGTFQVP